MINMMVKGIMDYLNEEIGTLIKLHREATDKDDIQFYGEGIGSIGSVKNKVIELAKKDLEDISHKINTMAFEEPIKQNQIKIVNNHYWKNKKELEEVVRNGK